MKAVVSSMTGYGTARHSDKNLTLEIEVKTVNNRFLDVSVRMPRDYSEYEMKLRELATKYFKRGRVDIQILRNTPTGARKVALNREAFDKLCDIYLAFGKKMKVVDKVYLQRMVLDLLSRRDVLEIEEQPADQKREMGVLFKIADKALEQAYKTRLAEGKRLIADVKKRAAEISNLRVKIAAISKKGLSRSRDVVLSKIKNLTSDFQLDPARLELEVAVLVSRADITEELVRLEAHLATFQKELGGSVEGKRVDFMLQELLREFNTIASKSNDAAITTCVIAAKGEIEKIREQAQNLE